MDLKRCMYLDEPHLRTFCVEMMLLSTINITHNWYIFFGILISLILLMIDFDTLNLQGKGYLGTFSVTKQSANTV